MSGPILEMRGVSKSFFGIAALRNVDLTVYAGEIHALMGENGAGKSTLIKVIGGVYTPDTGAVEVDGVVYHGLTPAQARRTDPSQATLPRAPERWTAASCRSCSQPDRHVHAAPGCE